MKRKAGEPIGVKETLTDILIAEKGELLFYQPIPESYRDVLTGETVKQATKYYPGIIYKEEDRKLYSLASGYLIGLLGLVYDKTKRSFIDESAKLWTSDLATSEFVCQYHQPPVKHLPGVTLSCLTIGSDGGFYHFFHEVLPKFFFCQSVLPYTDHILINGPPVDWKEKWLRHIGLDLDKVIWIAYNSHYVCDQLLFTNRLIKDQHISNWSLNALKTLLRINETAAGQSSGDMIWISRKNVFARMIAWEDEVLRQFPAVKKVDVRDLSVTETIVLFSNASHVISAHGAGLSNILMCRPGTKILELFPDIKGYQPCYFRISTLCGLQHFVAEADFYTEAGMQDCLSFLEDFLQPAD
ncbi:DUF563 domain-containing protein [Mucilaginibacter sp.]|uniref:glycosyltransferase family 61 protein n=1 Tax=Mucilaginibacter sp. TaxID=1882438 RepID=UPI00261ED1C7|nr:glycosyltransferase family 61 protein [Mucilaginibacter sp.]